MTTIMMAFPIMLTMTMIMMEFQTNKKSDLMATVMSSCEPDQARGLFPLGILMVSHSGDDSDQEILPGMEEESKQTDE